MKTATTLMMLLFLLVPTRSLSQQPADAEPKVEVQIVKYDALAKAIKKQQGKVVVVYFWASYDTNSMKLFPALKEMQENFVRKDLVIVTVSLGPEPKEDKDRIHKFLTRTKATFPNFILDEEPEVWSEKFKIRTPPGFAIYDQRGQRITSLDLTQSPGEPEPIIQQAEKFVRKLIPEKRP